MPNLIADAKNRINEILLSAYQQAAKAGELPSDAELKGTVEIPKDLVNGDFAANHAMAGAKALHMSPRAIADALVKNACLDNTWFDSIEVAGPGFINFRLNHSWYEDVLHEINKSGDDYGKIDEGKGRSVMVEFVSANPTGPMHMGNARGGVLGDALASVLSMAGYKSYREFYVNDTGNQIEKFAQSIDLRYRQLVLGEESVYFLKDDETEENAKVPEGAIIFPKDCYHGEDIITIAKLFREKYGDEYLNKPKEERFEVMSTFGLDNNIPKMKKDLERYGISYDNWFFESSLHNTGYVEDTMNELTRLGYTYEKDGALWLKTTELVEGCEKDDVLRRANGFYTYFASDIAYHRNKLLVRGFDNAINVWGADHHGHVARLKGALDALGLDGTHRLDIVLMQLVKLQENGVEVRMSKRTGKMISLSNLLDDIPVDAARYFFNSRPESAVIFDLELAKRQDSENPVYYVQYAHARICTMIANLESEGYGVLEDADLSLLNEEAEKDLIRQLALLPETIRIAARDYDPSHINTYVTELATRFHKFYTVCRLKGEKDDILNARLYLADTVRKVLEISLNVIGVSAPEKM